MDAYDRKIIRILQQDCRTSLQAIGAAVGLSASPCWARINKLQDAGVIEGYTVRLNADALGLHDSVLVQISLDTHSEDVLEEFIEAIAQIPEVVDASLVSGDYDCFARVAVADTRDYERFLRERLYKVNGIRQTRSNFVLRNIKSSGLPLPAD